MIPLNRRSPERSHLQAAASPLSRGCRGLGAAPHLSGRGGRGSVAPVAPVAPSYELRHLSPCL